MVEFKMKEKNVEPHPFEIYKYAFNIEEECLFTFDEEGHVIEINYTIKGLGEEYTEGFSKMKTWEELIEIWGYNKEDFIFFTDKEIKIIIEKV